MVTYLTFRRYMNGAMRTCIQYCAEFQIKYKKKRLEVDLLIEEGAEKRFLLLNWATLEFKRAFSILKYLSFVEKHEICNFLIKCGITFGGWLSNFDLSNYPNPISKFLVLSFINDVVDRRVQNNTFTVHFNPK